MTWFWLNIPLATVFFLAWTLVPAWLVIKHPDTGPRPPRPPRPHRPAARRVTAAPAPARFPPPPGGYLKPGVPLR